MKSLCVGLTCVLAATMALGNSSDSDSNEKSRANQRVAELGGFVTYPGSQKGMVAFIDTQDAVAVQNVFAEIFGHFQHQLPIRIDLQKAKFSDYAELKRNAKASFAIVFIYDEKQPTSGVFPEEGYAFVNFARYKNGLKLPADDMMYKRRCVKAALKAFALLCGGGGSQYPGQVTACRTAQDLDAAYDKLPIDTQSAMKKYLEAAGVTPVKRTIYRKAVQEGWAPQPTNDFQRTIWKQVHQIPDKPITIEYDPKVDK